MTNAIVSRVVGAERAIRAVVELSGEISTPAVVQRDTDQQRTWFALGELDGTVPPRLERIRDVLSAAARVDLAENIEGAKWTKLVVNSMTMGPFGLFGLKNWEAAKLPGILDISVRLGREAVAVGEAYGYRLEPIFGLTAEEFAGPSDETLVNRHGDVDAPHRHCCTVVAPASSRGLQHRSGARPHEGRRIEMEFITGVVRRGAEAGVATPCSEALLGSQLQIDTGEPAMEPSNLQPLHERIAAVASDG